MANIYSMEIYKMSNHFDFKIKPALLERWKALADIIGIPLTSLIHIAMHKYESNNYTNITILKWDFDKNIKEKNKKSVISNKLDNVDTVKCPKCKKAFTKRGLSKHTAKCKTYNKGKDKKPYKITKSKCPKCKKMFDNRGFNLHVNSCILIPFKPMPKDKKDRLRENMKYRGTDNRGRMDT